MTNCTECSEIIATKEEVHEIYDADKPSEPVEIRCEDCFDELLATQLTREDLGL